MFRLPRKQRFDLVRKLGQGTYGKVQLGINKETGQEVSGQFARFLRAIDLSRGVGEPRSTTRRVDNDPL